MNDNAKEKLREVYKELEDLVNVLRQLNPIYRRVIYSAVRDVTLGGQPWDFLSKEECTALEKIVTAIELIDLGTENMPCKIIMRKKKTDVQRK